MSSETKHYVKGLEGVIAGKTSLSLVDGAESKLYYRGIPVHELSEHSTYEETVYLLWYGKLPTKPALDEFKKKLVADRGIAKAAGLAAAAGRYGSIPGKVFGPFP